MKISSNGIRLNVSDTGAGETALVFQHYWGGSSRTWSEVPPLLRDRFRCVAIDARGAGDSDAPETGYSMEDHAHDAMNVIQSLALTRYILVGHSMGGKTSQLLAAKRPQGLLGLVLVASSPLSPMTIDEDQRKQMMRAYSNRESVEWTLDNVLVGSPISSESRSRLIEDALRLSPAARSGWVEVGSREDFGKHAVDIDAPIAILAGELDRVDPLPVVKTHIVSLYPSAPVYFLSGKGHLLPVEAPRDVATVIRSMADKQR